MTTAFVATIGGHISELVELAGRIPVAGDAVWITSDTAQTRELLRGRTVEFVPFIGERDATGVLAAVGSARRSYRRFGVDRVISTGSAIALAYLPTAAALGIDAHYIESSTRVTSISLTGRILSRTPRVRCWWQYPAAPSGFGYAGGVYDHYASTGASRSPELRRIVVTVGTTDRCFRRLIARLVEIVPAGAEVLWQTGCSDVSGLGIEANELVAPSVLSDAIAEADAVVSHAGAGSLSLALRAGKVPVFVPRRAAHGEQVDDHQVELARWADGEALAIWAEADEVGVGDLMAAAGRRVTTSPPEAMVLDVDR